MQVENLENVRSVYIDILLRRIRENEKGDFSMLWGNEDMSILLNKQRLDEEQELMHKWNFEKHEGKTEWWYYLPTKRCVVTTEVWSPKDPDDSDADDFSSMAHLLGPNKPGGFILHCKFYPLE